jgi:hypothetical protein
MITVKAENKLSFLQPRETKFYPPDNNPGFEEWFLDNYDESRNKSDRIYLPVLVTELNKLCLRNRKARILVDDFFRRLDKSKKYFMIVQHDDCVLFNMHGADVKIFGMGCKGDVQLPLVCQPHKYEFKETGRPIFASFIGSITHPIRQRLVDELQGRDGYFISTEHTSLHSYCYIMSMSKFALCPRGYGKTSFRIQEALQYGAIPIYISDEFLFTKGCHCFTDVEMAVKFIELHPELRLVQDFYENYSYSAVENMIYENL